MLNLRDTSANASGHNTVKPRRVIFNEVRSYRGLALYARACELARRLEAQKVPRSSGGQGLAPSLHRLADLRQQLHRTGVPHFSPDRARDGVEPPEVHLGTPNHEYFQLPDCPCRRVWQLPTTNKKVTGVKYGGIRQLHHLLVNLLSKRLRRAKTSH